MVVRVTNNFLTNRMLANLNKTLVRLSDLQQQLSTGKLINKPSDNPNVMSLALRMRSSYYTDRQFEKNLDYAQMWLAITESSISSGVDAIANMQTEVIRAGDGALDSESLVAIADGVRETINQLIQLGNSTIGGNYIFAGNETQTNPFKLITGISGTETVEYSGDYGSRMTEISTGELFRYNLDGADVFFAGLESITSYNTVSDATQVLSSQFSSTSPPPSGGNFAGTFTINGKTITVTGTDTLNSLSNKINLADAGVVASIDGNNHLVLESKRGEPIDMSNGTSNIMTALGMYKQVIGEDLGSGITTSTLLSSLGISPETMRIETDSGVGDMFLGSTTSVGALINNINILGIGVTAYVNSDGTGLVVSATSTTSTMEVTNLRKIYGNNIGSGITESTTVASLGLTLGTLEIVNDAVSIEVDLSSAVTIGDVITLMEESGAGVYVKIKGGGNGLNVEDILQISPYLQIREVGGGTTANQLGLLKTSSGTTATDLGIEGEGAADQVEALNIFDTLIEFEELLRSGLATDEDYDRILEELVKEYDYMLQAQSQVGVKVNRLDAEESRLLDAEVDYLELISMIEDADLASTVTNLTMAENAYTASLEATSMILSQSLLDFLI